MATLKFIHAADIHLGRPFSGLTNSSPTLGRLFREAGYQAWDNLVKVAIKNKADFVTLAGDTFDNANPTVRSRVAFRKGLEDLYQVGIPVYMAPGNHDPLSSFPDSLQSLPGLNLFGPDPTAMSFTATEHTEGVLIFGAGFEKSAVRENLAVRFRRDCSAELAIGVLHANVSGMSGHKDYAPCTLDDLKTAGMDVWCLGHVHSPAILCENPLIFYPGTTQGAHINERGPRGCYLVTIDNDSATAEFLPLGSVRWEKVDLEAGDLSAVEDLIDMAEGTCSHLSSESDSTHAIVARINLKGRDVSQSVRSAARTAEFLEVLTERLANLPVPVFPESVCDLTRSSIDLESLMKEDGFLGDFLRLCHQVAEDPSERDMQIEGLEAELSRLGSRAYLDPQLDPQRLKEDPQTLSELVDQAADLVIQTFL